METIKFEKLYLSMLESIYDKNVIIFTHTLIEDWCKQPNIKKILYVLVGIHIEIIFMMMEHTKFTQITK